MEGFLDGVEMVGIGSQAFDGENVVAVGLDREEQARTHRLAVEEDGAGPAHAMLTPHVGAGEAQVVADKVAEEQSRLDLALVGDAVDADGDGDSLAHAVTSWPAARARACVRVR